MNLVTFVLQVFGLYKGLASPICGIAFINAIIFGVQANTLKLMDDPDSLRAHFASGAVAGFAQSFICSPTELAKIRIQMSGLGQTRSDYRTKPHRYTGSLNCLAQVIRQEGLQGVYKGLGTTLLREVPAFSTYFFTYEYLCQRMKPWTRHGQVGVAGFFFAGGLAGVASWVVCYPQDVIKSRVQADGLSGPLRYRSAWDCLVKSYRAEGLPMFVEGFSSALLRAFPVNAATFATFSLLMRHFRSLDADVMKDELFTSASTLLAVDASDFTERNE